jgi:hypothetical protein
LEAKKDQLAKHLGPVATMVRQLGLSDEDALRVFDLVLRREPGESEDREGRS